MSQLLRKIRLNRWDAPVDGAWIPEGDIQADPLPDLGTKGGRLSVWVINEDRSNLERVMGAITGNYQHLAHLDYLMFDERVLADLGLEVKETIGNSPDDKANAQWHRDLIELSAGRLAALAQTIFRCRERARFPEKKVRQLLTKALQNEWIDGSRIKPTLLCKIDPSLASDAAPLC